MNQDSETFQFPCKYLRSKEMYYQSSSVEDPFASGLYWCTRTHETFGPDGELVNDAECKPGRKCFED